MTLQLKTVVEIQRFGDLLVEYHDIEQGWLPRDPSTLRTTIDVAFDIDHPSNRLIDYAVKEIEARIILGTLSTAGRLAREAELRGISVQELAELVLQNADAEKPDLDRVQRKLDL